MRDHNPFHGLINPTPAGCVRPGDIPYRTTDPIPDGHTRPQPVYGLPIRDAVASGQLVHNPTAGHPKPKHLRPDPHPLPLRIRLYAALIAALVLAAAGIGIWRR